MDIDYRKPYQDPIDPILARRGGHVTTPPIHEDEHVDNPFEEQRLPSVLTTLMEAKTFLRSSCKVLVVGAGGLGCEFLKNLALMGFGHLEIIDMDTIEMSNLNRQFLFQEHDIGKPKAMVAATAVQKRCSHVTIVPHYGKIQDYTLEFYQQFDMIVCGLDSVEARRWINGMLFQIAQRQPDRLIPMLDGGTEGFKGHLRVILPHRTACFECSLDTFPPQITYPICTLAHTPRQPEHCVEWAILLEWPRLRPHVVLDTDVPEHIQWIYETALTRATAFRIEGVTYRLTQGIVKQIIPAIASTNAIIAAIGTNEAFKMATGVGPSLQNYMMINGASGIYTYTFEYERKPDCLVCGHLLVSLQCSKDTLLCDMIDQLSHDARFQLKKPSIRTLSGFTLYMQAPPPLEEASRPNLNHSLAQLLGSETDVTCILTDPTFPTPISLRLFIL
jgi:ubiquitin-activating enzyme E1 C